jgi:phosphoglycolate phosphatase-like HAD superfamily hydrolase
MRLILFDVDGTLVDCGRQVRPLFASALEEVFGTAGDVEGYDFAGKTDARIVLDLVTAAGVPAERVAAGLDRARALYLARLAAGLRPEGMRLLPGVREVLERLAARGDLTLGLLTGNWEAGARLKLAPFDLNRFFPFGAFGDDGVERAQLPPVALARAAAYRGEEFLAAETLIVGDSLLDVACARAHGLRALAVATGRTAASSLRAAGADWVVADLWRACECHPVFAA